MLVVDASCLFEVVTDGAVADAVRDRLGADIDQHAPHLVDAEVAAVIQVHHRRGRLDDTAAALAIDDLAQWPAARWSHVPLLRRAWELRANVRAHDALYIALAEALDATLLTLDARLGRAPGVRCDVDVVAA